jgi:hypothetical protein
VIWTLSLDASSPGHGWIWTKLDLAQQQSSSTRREAKAWQVAALTLSLVQQPVWSQLLMPQQAAQGNSRDLLCRLMAADRLLLLFHLLQAWTGTWH